mmetsp:Transcript_41431/g.47818  ORF Transcript_41431/g.47818 Transcript_41431/m.47818 type:complete len:82 (+) Transcript_41431:956-1201(+)
MIERMSGRSKQDSGDIIGCGCGGTSSTITVGGGGGDDGGSSIDNADSNGSDVVGVVVSTNVGRGYDVAASASASVLVVASG